MKSHESKEKCQAKIKGKRTITKTPKKGAYRIKARKKKRDRQENNIRVYVVFLFFFFVLLFFLVYIPHAKSDHPEYVMETRENQGTQQRTSSCTNAPAACSSSTPVRKETGKQEQRRSVKRDYALVGNGQAFFLFSFFSETLPHLLLPLRRLRIQLWQTSTAQS